MPSYLPVSSSEQQSEDSSSVPASLLEEQIRQRSSIVFNIDEDDYLVSLIFFVSRCGVDFFQFQNFLVTAEQFVVGSMNVALVIC